MFRICDGMHAHFDVEYCSEALHRNGTNALVDACDSDWQTQQQRGDTVFDGSARSSQLVVDVSLVTPFPDWRLLGRHHQRCVYITVWEKYQSYSGDVHKAASVSCSDPTRQRTGRDKMGHATSIATSGHCSETELLQRHGKRNALHSCSDLKMILMNSYTYTIYMYTICVSVHQAGRYLGNANYVA